MHVYVQMSTGFIKKAEHEVYKCPVRNWNQVLLSGILLGNKKKLIIYGCIMEGSTPLCTL